MRVCLYSRGSFAKKVGRLWADGYATVTAIAAAIETVRRPQAMAGSNYLLYRFWCKQNYSVLRSRPPSCFPGFPSMPMFPYTARAFLGVNYSAAGSLITPPWCELLRRTFNQICTVPLVPRRFLQLHAVAIAGSRSR